MRSEEADIDSEQKTEVPSPGGKPERSPGLSAGKVKMDLPKPNKTTGFAGFGKGFEGNLRNAFL